MTDKALEAAYAVAGNACKTCQGGDACNGFECRIAFEAAISAYISALPGEAEVVAWRWKMLKDKTWTYDPAEWFVDKNKSDPSMVFDPLVTLASLQAMQARAEKAERERDEAYNKGYSARDGVVSVCRSRAEAAEARVKELEDKLSEAADEIEGWGAYANEYFQEKHDLTGVVREFREFALKGGSNG